MNIKTKNPGRQLIYRGYGWKLKQPKLQYFYAQSIKIQYF